MQRMEIRLVILFCFIKEEISCLAICLCLATLWTWAMVTRARRHEHITSIFKHLVWRPITERIQFIFCQLSKLVMVKVLHISQNSSIKKFLQPGYDLPHPLTSNWYLGLVWKHATVTELSLLQLPMEHFPSEKFKMLLPYKHLKPCCRHL